MVATGQTFVRNGHCADRYHAFDWNSIDRAGDHATALDSFIDEVRQKHGVEQVDLIVHSAGGRGQLHLYGDRLSGSENKKIRAHRKLSKSAPEAAIEAGVDVLNVWSPDDTVVEGADIDGVENRQMKGQDHYEVATSKEASEKSTPSCTVSSPSTSNWNRWRLYGWRAGL